MNFHPFAKVTTTTKKPTPNNPPKPQTKQKVLIFIPSGPRLY